MARLPRTSVQRSPTHHRPKAETDSSTAHMVHVSPGLTRLAVAPAARCRDAHEDLHRLARSARSAPVCSDVRSAGTRPAALAIAFGRAGVAALRRPAAAQTRRCCANAPARAAACAAAMSNSSCRACVRQHKLI